MDPLRCSLGDKGHKLNERIESLKDGIAALAQSGMPLKTAMAAIKRLYVEAALAHSQGMQTRAGRLIKAHRNTVSRIAQGKGII